MFEGFANVWTPALLAAKLGRKPVRVRIAGEPVVLFRGPDGAPGALIDRCPHRGSALSLGQVGVDGCIECPFHGWRFGVDGSNRRVPLNPDARRDRLGATPLPVRRLGELIWIRTSPGVESPDEPAIPEGLTARGLARVYLDRVWACHWTRAMENMLDSPHVPFVHRATIGRAFRKQMTLESRLDVAWEETPWGGRARSALDGQESPAFLEYFRPGVMALNIPIPGRRLQIYALVTPIDRNHTRLTVAGSRDFARLPLLDPLFAWINGRIADEDKAVVESSSPSEIPSPGAELSVSTDRATLQFRKYYIETLKSSSAVAA